MDKILEVEICVVPSLLVYDSAVLWLGAKFVKTACDFWKHACFPTSTLSDRNHV